MQFAEGDLVQLKSGGPTMTVEQQGEAMDGRMMVWCVWFENRKPMRDTFPASTLQKVEQ